MARTKLASRHVSTPAGSKWLAAALLVPDIVNNNYADNDGLTYLYLVNGATPRTCTVVTPATLGDQPVDDLVISMAANELGLFGPFRPDVYGPQLLLNFSAVDLKCLVFSLLPEVRL